MELIYQFLIVFVILQRLLEIILSKSNERFIVKSGGMVLAEKNYILMVLLHVGWLGSLAYITFLSQLEFNNSTFLFFGFLFLLGQLLRMVAIVTLGRRWSTRVMILPKAPVVNNGIFKYIQHPNYLGVCLEILSLPLMANQYFIALFFSLVNALVLFFRIRFEEKSLSTYNNYQESFPKKFT